MIFIETRSSLTLFEPLLEMAHDWLSSQTHGRYIERLCHVCEGDYAEIMGRAEKERRGGAAGRQGDSCLLCTATLVSWRAKLKLN